MASNEFQQDSNAHYDDLITVKKLVVKKKSKDMLKSGSASDEMTSRLNNIHVPINPPVLGKPSQEDMKIMLEPLRIKRLIIPIGGLPKDPLDARQASNKHKNLANFSTNVMTFQSIAKDGEAINHIKQVDLHTVNDREYVEKYIEAVERSMEYIGSSGSAQGVLNRLVSGMTEATPVQFDTAQCVKWANEMIKYEFIDHEYRGSSLSDQLSELKEVLKFNKNSNAGVPYYRKLGTEFVYRDEEGDLVATTAFGKAVDVGNMLVNAIAEGTFNDVIDARRSLVAVCLKNKQDVYRFDQLTEKIRPYYVYPLHERLMYSVLQTKLKPVLFYKGDKSTCSAVGFSWNYGGGDILYEWIETNSTKIGFHCLFYGDDQLWVITTKFGCYVVTPDFSHMDLSLGAQWAEVMYKVWKPYYKNIDKTWKNVLQFNCQRGFMAPVIVDGALTYQFMSGWKSGIPGTTKGDEVASAAINGFIREQFNEQSPSFQSGEDVRIFLDRMVVEVKGKFGMIFKKTSMGMHLFVKEQESYDFEFLGQTLVKVYASRRHYVPKPSLLKLIISATTLKKNYAGGIVKQKAAKSRARSLYAGGGYLYPLFRNALYKYFESLDKRGISCLSQEESAEEYGDNIEESAFFEDHTKELEESWPSFEWAMNLYLPPDDQLVEFSGRSQEDTMTETSNQEPINDTAYAAGFSKMRLESSSSSSDTDDNSESASVSTARSYGIKEPNLNEITAQEIDAIVNPKKWADFRKHERVDEDEGGAKIPILEEVEVKFQAQLQKLSAQEKQEWAERSQKAREAAKKLYLEQKEKVRLERIKIRERELRLAGPSVTRKTGRKESRRKAKMGDLNFERVD